MKLRTIQRKLPKLIELFIEQFTKAKKDGAMLHWGTRTVHLYYIYGNKVCIKEKGEQSIKNVPFNYFLNNIDNCKEQANKNEFYSHSLFIAILSYLVTKNNPCLKLINGYKVVGESTLRERGHIRGVLLSNDEGKEINIDYFEFFDYLDI